MVFRTEMRYELIARRPFQFLYPIHTVSMIEGRHKQGWIGMGKRTDHKPDQLSGGEMQRVAIARALIADPLLILADEPTGNLDSKTGDAILKLMREMTDKTGKTIVMVTHDLKAAQTGNRLIRMRDGSLESDESL